MKMAIVGATGNVGRKIIEVLEQKKLSIENLHLLASKKSSGKELSFKGKKTGGFLRYRLGCLDALKKMEKEEPQRYQEIRFPELLMLLPGKYPK